MIRSKSLRDLIEKIDQPKIESKFRNNKIVLKSILTAILMLRLRI